MRFITEFETTYDGYDHPNYAKIVSSYKKKREDEIGAKIGEIFGWKEDCQRFRILNTLEIEAFPMDKWMEFKRRLTDALPDYDVTSRTRIMNAMADLESFAGATNPDNINNQK